MIVIWVAIFFVLTCVAAWLLVFPETRERCARSIGRVWRSLTGRIDRIGSRASSHVANSGRTVRDSGARVSSNLKRHRFVASVAIALVCIPPALILLLRQTVVLDGYSDEDASPSNPLIAELLRGERLIPPQAPPPDVFTTADVLRERPEIVTADRKWDRIDGDLQQRMLAVFKVMREQYGYEMVLIEGYRSPVRQATLPKSVTRAGPWQSCHQFGLAADSAVFRNGKLQWDLGDAWVRRGYMLYGELAQQAGLDWGGNWRSFKDYPHAEKSQACVAAKRSRLKNS